MADKYLLPTSHSSEISITTAVINRKHEASFGKILTLRVLRLFLRATPIRLIGHHAVVLPMPTLGADKAKQCYCIKRGKGKGYSGVVNELFFADNTRMVFGDAKDVMSKMI